MTQEQALMWSTLDGMPAPERVIHLHCSDEAMIDRVTTRVRQTKREDDNEATATTAIERFHEACNPVIETFTEDGLCTTIDTGPEQGSIDGASLCVCVFVCVYLWWLTEFAAVCRYGAQRLTPKSANSSKMHTR